MKKNTIVIAPFSINSIFLYHQLYNEGKNVIAFMDKDRLLHNKSYEDAQIIPYFYLNSNTTIIVAKCSDKIKKEIYMQLMSLNYSESNVLFAEQLDVKTEIKDIADDINYLDISKIKNIDWIKSLKNKIIDEMIKDKLSINTLNILLTTKCTLKCDGCAAMMDYFHLDQQRNMNIDYSIRSFNIIMKNIDFVHEIIPIGGEPFMNSQIFELLKHIVSSNYKNKIGKVVIITNGTIIPSVEVLELLGKNKDFIEVFISDYGDLSRKKLELVLLLNKYGCTYHNHMHDVWYLTNQPIIPPLDITEEDVAIKCGKCNCKKGGALRIVEEKIYPCHFVAFATENKTIPYERENFLNVDEDIINKQSLKEFIESVHPGMKYCSTPTNKEKSSNIIIPVGKQISKPHNCKRYE